MNISSDCDSLIALLIFFEGGGGGGVYIYFMLSAHSLHSFCIIA